MTNNLHEVVPHFLLYLTIKNAQTLARKHFENTNKESVCHLQLKNVQCLKLISTLLGR